MSACRFWKEFPRTQSNDLNNLILSRCFQWKIKKKKNTQHTMYLAETTSKAWKIVSKDIFCSNPSFRRVSLCCPVLPNEFTLRRMTWQRLCYPKIIKKAHGIRCSTDTWSPGSDSSLWLALNYSGCQAEKQGSRAAGVYPLPPVLLPRT